jgi:hypothetical protein
LIGAALEAARVALDKVPVREPVPVRDPLAA